MATARSGGARNADRIPTGGLGGAASAGGVPAGQAGARCEGGWSPAPRPRLADSIPRQPDTREAWRTFEASLADALGLLEEDEYLVIGSKRRNHYVQFAAQGHHGMWIEAASNAFIDEPADRLSDVQHEHLAALGWDGPQEFAPGPQTLQVASTQGNFFVDAAAPVPVATVARLACTTLHDVYGIPHPGDLEYVAFHRRGDSIRFPTLRLQRRVRAPRSGQEGPP